MKNCYFFPELVVSRSDRSQLQIITRMTRMLLINTDKKIRENQFYLCYLRSINVTDKHR